MPWGGGWGDTRGLCKDIEKDTGGPKTHFICAVQASCHGDPGAETRGSDSASSPNAVVVAWPPPLPGGCLVRASTLGLVAWGFWLPLWPWGAGCASESPPGHLGLEPWVSHPALGEQREAAWCLEGEESWAHRKGGARLGMRHRAEGGSGESEVLRSALP